MNPLSGPTPIVDAIHGKPRQDPWIEAAYSELLDNARNLERLLAEAVGALEKHGKHISACYDKRQVVPRCVCGLNEALSRIKAAGYGGKETET